MSECAYGFSGRTVVVSLLLGAAAGAAAVLLLAPKARRESAERIRTLSRDLKERASDTIDTAKEKVAATVSRGKDFIEEKRAVFSSAVAAGKEVYARRTA